MLELDDIQSGVLRPAARSLCRGVRAVSDRRSQRGTGIDPPHTSMWWLRLRTRRAQRRHVGERRTELSRPESVGRAANVARELLSGVSAGHGGPRRSAGRHRRKQSRTLGEAARIGRRPRRTYRSRPGFGAAGSGARHEPAKSTRRTQGITAIWRQDCHVLPNEREAFGFKDGISHPAIEGSGIPGTNPHEQPLKPGEFVLGYPDEMGGIPQIP